MKRYTLEQFNEILGKADSIKPASHSKSNTRHGSYIHVQTGLSSKTIFFGYEVEKDLIHYEMIFELVG